MLVVCILDCGFERNLVVTGLTFEGDFVFVDAAGLKHRFRTADIVEIVPVYNAEARRDLAPPLSQRELAPQSARGASCFAPVGFGFGDLL
jgi:hypothetical protein